MTSIVLIVERRWTRRGEDVVLVIIQWVMVLLSLALAIILAREIEFLDESLQRIKEIKNKGSE